MTLPTGCQNKRANVPFTKEAEWEYAARSGGKDEVWAGTSDEKQLDDYAVFEQESNRDRRETANRTTLGCTT